MAWCFRTSLYGSKKSGSRSLVFEANFLKERSSDLSFLFSTYDSAVTNNWQQVSFTEVAPKGRVWRILFACCYGIERFNRTLGLSIAWLALLMALTVFVVVILRYGFSTGAIWLQESALYMHGLLFMLAAAYCMQQGQHVRIDIFYSSWSPRRQALVDLGGTLFFLLPVTIFTFFIAWEYVISSWQYLEKSRESTGLPLVFALKTVLLIMPAILFLQAIADGWRHCCFLCGWIDYKAQEETKAAEAKGSLF